MKKRRPLTDEEGEVRELTVEDFKLFRPIAEVDPGMVDAMKLTGDNARIRGALGRALERYPEMQAAVDAIALSQPTTASLEQIRANLWERADAVIEQRPDVRDLFKDLPR
jgi:hypothetical protein